MFIRLILTCMGREGVRRKIVSLSFFVGKLDHSKGMACLDAVSVEMVCHKKKICDGMSDGIQPVHIIFMMLRF